MVDTVSYILADRIYPLPIPKGWRDFSYKNQDGFKGYGRTHPRTGLKVQDVFGQTVVTVSLPRLHFGTNRSLLTSQENIDEALERADVLVNELSQKNMPVSRAAFSRIDLAWQIKGNAKDVIYSLLNFSYPGIRKAPRIYMGETIFWESPKQFSLSIYDKEREQNRRMTKAGEILRIELRLYRKKIQEFFKVAPLKELSFSECYQVFRSAVLELSPQPHPRLISVNQIYKYAIENNWEIQGMPAFNFLIKDLTTEKRIRQAVTQLRLKLIHLDLEKEFPPLKPNKVKITKSGFDYSIPPVFIKNKSKPRHRPTFVFQKPA